MYIHREDLRKRSQAENPCRNPMELKDRGPVQTRVAGLLRVKQAPPVQHEFQVLNGL